MFLAAAKSQQPLWDISYPSIGFFINPQPQGLLQGRRQHRLWCIGQNWAAATTKQKFLCPFFPLILDWLLLVFCYIAPCTSRAASRLIVVWFVLFLWPLLSLGPSLPSGGDEPARHIILALVLSFGGDCAWSEGIRDGVGWVWDGWGSYLGAAIILIIVTPPTKFFSTGYVLIPTLILDRFCLQTNPTMVSA